MGWEAIKKVLAAAAIFGGAGFILFATLKQNSEIETHRAAASAAGFANVSEYDEALELGANTPQAWRAKRAELDAAKIAATVAAKAKADEDAARAQREWDAAAPQRAKEAEARRPPQDKVSLINQSWKAGGFGSVGLMSFTVNNENDYPIKDFVIICYFDAASGTELGTRAHVVFDLVKAKTKRPFKEVNIGLIPSQSARAICRLISAMKA